jgi:hypothetical protein
VAVALHTVVIQLEIGAATVLLVLGVAAIVLPVCGLIAGKAFLGNRLDATLWAFEIGEIVSCLILFWISTGAWTNYAIQAVVFASVLTARAVARAVVAAPSPRFLLVTVLATGAVLGSTFNEVFDTTLRLLMDRSALEALFAHLNRPPSLYFFADRPGLNRIHGRVDLVYDDWLYPVFESLHMAEPRSIWLRRELTMGRVRSIVTSSDRPELEGIGTTLRELGYRPDTHAGPFFVWTR